MEVWRVYECSQSSQVPITWRGVGSRFWSALEWKAGFWSALEWKAGFWSTLEWKAGFWSALEWKAGLWSELEWKAASDSALKRGGSEPWQYLQCTVPVNSSSRGAWPHDPPAPRRPWGWRARAPGCPRPRPPGGTRGARAPPSSAQSPRGQRARCSPSARYAPPRAGSAYLDKVTEVFIFIL